MSLKSPLDLPKILRSPAESKGGGGGVEVAAGKNTFSRAVKRTLPDVETLKNKLRLAAEDIYVALTQNLNSKASEPMTQIEKRVAFLTKFGLNPDNLTADFIVNSSPEDVKEDLFESLKSWYAQKLAAWQKYIDDLRFEHPHLAGLEFSPPEFYLGTLPSDINHEPNEIELLYYSAHLSRSDETITVRAYYKIDDAGEEYWSFDLDVDTADDSRAVYDLPPLTVNKLAQLTEGELKTLAVHLDENVGKIYEWPKLPESLINQAVTATKTWHSQAEGGTDNFDTHLATLISEPVPTNEAEIPGWIEAGVKKLLAKGLAKMHEALDRFAKDHPKLGTLLQGATIKTNFEKNSEYFDDGDRSNFLFALELHIDLGGNELFPVEFWRYPGQRETELLEIAFINGAKGAERQKLKELMRNFPRVSPN